MVVIDSALVIVILQLVMSGNVGYGLLRGYFLPHLYPSFCMLAPTIDILQGRKALFPPNIPAFAWAKPNDIR